MTHDSLDWLRRQPIAHRGYHDNNLSVPENSRAAFSAALDAGFPIELDVQLLKDGTVVVFHDQGLERACGRPGQVADLTREQLRVMRLFQSTETIPTLAEVLALVAGRVPLLIELKNFTRSRALEQAVLDLLAEYEGPFALQSFNPLAVRWLKKQQPELAVGLLAPAQTGAGPAYRLLNLFLLHRRRQPDFIGFDREQLPHPRAAIFQQQGIPVLAWTVRSQAQFEAVRPYCDNIIFEGFLPALPAATPPPASENAAR
jgi:glycerophosphoryl diester phosphodiesterase